MRHNITDRPLWDIGRFEFRELVSGPGERDPYAILTHGAAAGDVRLFGTRTLDRVIREAGLADFEIDDDAAVQYRGPQWHRIWWARAEAQGLLGPWSWHQDGEPSNPERGYVTTWSNVLPTEIRRKDTHQMVPTKAGHLYVFDNLKFEHRGVMPTHGAPDRAFLRGYLEPKAETGTAVQHLLAA